MDKDLKLIYDYQKEITTISQIGALLGWDQLTYMPSEGVHSRSEQTSLISHWAYKKTVDENLFNALKRLLKKKLDKKDALVVEKLYKDISKTRKLPEHFVKELSKAT